MSEKENRITAEDLYELELISGPQISPDGSKIVYVLHRVEPKTEKKYSNLWMVKTDSGETQQFTTGDQSDANPKWSPDGKTIAFTSNRHDETQPQIYLIDTGGGEAQKLTDLKGTITNYSWSPDGKSLVMQFRKKDQEAIEREEDEAKKKLGVVARHYTRVFYKFDGQGYLPHEQFHIWTIEVETGEAQQLTEGDVHSELDPVWTPDGNSVVFRSNRQPDPDMDHQNFDIFVIPSSGGEIRKLETPPGMKALISVSPDGKWVSFIGPRDKNEWWMNNNLWIAPLDGSSAAQNLTGDVDLNCVPSVITDTDNGAGNPSPPVWSPDSRKIYFGTAEHGSNQLRVIDLNDGSLEAIIDEDSAMGMFSFDDDFRKLGYFSATMMDPGQLFVRDMESGQVSQLTHFNQELFENKDLGSVEEIWFEGADGDELQGWIIRPPDFDPTAKYPSILEIHGGPLAQYGNFFMHEFFYLAANGYVVYFSNPRGGRGYGEEHSKAIWGGWGYEDYADLMAFTDRIQQESFIDKDRMGVTGGSYGGYMSLWIIGHTDRYKAAVAQRVVSNLISMWGSSDLNYVFQQVFGDKAPWEDVDKLWEHSPMKYIGNATTPTLIIHSENDFRCPIEQGEQAFVALKRLGVDSEMVRFPEEPHGLSRQGRTDRRVVRLGHILRWFDRYLK